MTTNRRLAAIMVADVVGYSRMMEADEGGTLAALKERRKAVLEPVVKAHGGRVVKVMGDGVLVEFGSAVNAVQGAVELQKKMAEANEGVPKAPHILLRIGINLGDVIGEGADIYGDGVNVAARLEALAEPGSICVSRQIHDAVRGKIGASFIDVGEQILKNIGHPVHVYRLQLASTASSSLPSPSVLDKPSIAVLPFQNISGDPEQQYFCDGITEDIITELSRFRQMHVVSRNSSFRFRGIDVDMVRAGRELGVRYLLEGSVRRMGARFRVTAQLIDATTGNHVWAERYDNPQDEIFDVQDRLVRTIVGTLIGRMNAAGAEYAGRKPPASLAAYEYVLRGDALPLGNPAIEAEARILFEKAIEIDPGYARAYALLFFALDREWFRDMSGSDTSRDKAFKLAERAVALDETDSLCQLALGWALIGQRATAAGEQHIAKAAALNPNSPTMRASLAASHSFLGEPERAIACLTEARELDPYFSPSWYWGEMGIAHFIAGRHGEAIASFRRATNQSYWQQAWLAASYALAEQPDLAKICAAELMQRMPDFSISRFMAKGPLARAEDLKHLNDGLRKAGLPE